MPFTAFKHEPSSFTLYIPMKPGQEGANYKQNMLIRNGVMCDVSGGIHPVGYRQ